MPSRKKRLQKQIKSLRKVAADHVEKLKEDVESGRWDEAHHAHELDIINRDIARKLRLLTKRKKGQDD